MASPRFLALGVLLSAIAWCEPIPAWNNGQTGNTTTNAAAECANPPSVEHITTAATMGREMGMTCLLDRAEAQRSHPDFTQELPRKLLPTRAKEAQWRRRERR